MVKMSEELSRLISSWTDLCKYIGRGEKTKEFIQSGYIIECKGGSLFVMILPGLEKEKISLEHNQNDPPCLNLRYSGKL